MPSGSIACMQPATYLVKLFVELAGWAGDVCKGRIETSALEVSVNDN